MGSKVKVIQMATRRRSGLTVQWGPMFFVSFSWNLYYLKQNLVKLSTGQYWLNFDGEKGMSDCEGQGHWAVVYKSHFPATKALSRTETPVYT